MTAIHSLSPLLSELDRLLVREFMCWPWESEKPEVQAVWEKLTHPDNLAAMENQGRDVESSNAFAKGCTLRALADCRSRKAGQAEQDAAPDHDCT